MMIFTKMVLLTKRTVKTKMMMVRKMMVMVTMSHDRESIDRLILQTVAVPHGPNLSGNDCSQRTDRHQLPLFLLTKNSPNLFLSSPLCFWSLPDKLCTLDSHVLALRDQTWIDQLLFNTSVTYQLLFNTSVTWSCSRKMWSCESGSEITWKPFMLWIS